MEKIVNESTVCMRLLCLGLIRFIIVVNFCNNILFSSQINNMLLTREAVNNRFFYYLNLMKYNLIGRKWLLLVNYCSTLAQPVLNSGIFFFGQISVIPWELRYTSRPLIRKKSQILREGTF